MVVFLLCWWLSSTFAWAENQEIRDFQMRELIPLRLINLHGPIELKGWALDKIRAEIQWQDVPGEAGASRRPRIRFEKVGGVYELALDYDYGLPLEQKLKERQRPTPISKFKVWAPAQLKAELLGSRFSVQAEDWGGPLSAIQISGALNLKRIRSGTPSEGATQAMCESCDVKVENSDTNLRIVTGSGKVSLWDVQGKSLYAETRSGQIRAVRLRGRQAFVTQTGGVFGQDLHGVLEIHSKSGKIQVIDASGEMSGSCQSCAWTAKFRSWKQTEPSVLENSEGILQLELPLDLSSTLHLIPVQGVLGSEGGFHLAQWPKPSEVDPLHSGGVYVRGSDPSKVLKIVGIPSKITISPYLGR